MYVKFQKPQNVAIADGIVDAIRLATFNYQSNSNVRCRKKAPLYNVLIVSALKENPFSVNQVHAIGVLFVSCTT